MRYPRRILLHSALLALSACANDPVDWGPVSYRQSRLGDPDARSAILSAGLPAVPETVAPCIRSIRTAHDSADLFRVWWSSRTDSSIVLSMQRSPDQGASWMPPVVVESRDRGRRGCDRPAPGTLFDPVSGYLYFVYFVEPSDGAGVFFAHSMDKGEMFHFPVPVIYGNRPSAASVAGHSDSVVVVFEDPNASQPRIGYALSHTTGHIFEKRGQVTPDEARATAPWVRLDDAGITVWWKESDPSAAGNAERVGYRTGVWK